MKAPLGLLLAAFSFILVGHSATGQEKRFPLPILRVEAGMHTAMVNRISTDASGKLVLTVSNDATARLWEPSGRPLRTFLPFTSSGGEGSLSAGALSPDGTLAAVGGWTHGIIGSEVKEVGNFNVYIYDTSSGKMVRRFGGVPNVVTDLAFSKSGRYLAAGAGAGGLFVWDTATGELLGQDPKYGAACYGVDWSGDERLATTCFDDLVRLYSFAPGQLKLTKSVKPTLLKPYALRFSPDGTALAVGSYNMFASEVFDARKLTLAYFFEAPDVEFSTLPAVAWSADGQSFAAGGTWANAEAMRMVRLWSVSRQKPIRDMAVARDTIKDIRALPGGGFLFAATDPAWGFIAGPDAKSSKSNASTDKPFEIRGAAPIVDFRNGCDSFLVAPDGREVSILPYGSKNPLTFSIPARKLGGISADARKDWLRPRTSGLSITNWKNTRAPKLGNVPLENVGKGVSRSLAISPDNSSFVLGLDNMYCGYTADGVPEWLYQVPGACWAVTFCSYGRLLVTAEGDGTFTWRNMINKRKLLTLYPHADGKRWIMWAPEGYYDCSPGAEDMLVLHVNRGADKAADAFPISRFRGLLYRPDVIQRILLRGSVGEAQRLANEALGRGEDGPEQFYAVLESLSPPVVELETGGAFREVMLKPETTTLDLVYGVRQTGQEATTGVEVRLNGRPSDVAAPVPPKDGKTTLTLPLPPAFEGEVSVIASHALGRSTAATLRVRRSAPSGGKGKTPLPNLFVLSAGVAELAMNTTPTLAANTTTGQSKGQFQNLEFAADDAQSVATLLAAQKGKAFAQVETTVLLNQQATTTAVRDAIKAIREKAQPGDVMLFFFSGHGNHDPKTGKFHLVTYDTDPHRESETAFSGEEMSQLLGQVRASVVVALDACHSGSVLGMQQGEKYKAPSLDISGLANQLSSAEHGIVVLSSSTPDQFSFEDREAGGGLFTKALLEGLKGKAVKNGTITCGTLMQWIDKRVPELLGGETGSPEQTPVTVMPSGVPDFTLARPSSNK